MLKNTMPSTTLEDLFNDLRNVEDSDPSAIDKVLTYAEELYEESECFIQVLVKKLKNVSITWEQPWYQESGSLTKQLKVNGESPEDSYRSGMMTKDEIDHIAKNWRNFMRKFNVPDKLNSLAIWRNRDNNKSLPEEKARYYVMSFLARGLKRNMFQVYRHVLSYYGATKRGQYTKDEEKVMRICFHHCPKKAVPLLSCVLSREPRGIYMRLHILSKGKPALHRLKWNLDLATKFLNLLMKYTGEKLEGLKYKKIAKAIWLKIEKDFEKQHEYLQHFWNSTLHNQLFIKCRVTLKKLRIKVLKILKGSPYKFWRDIRWKEVQNKFPDGFTWKILYWTTIRLFNNYRGYSKVPLQELADYGLERIRSRGPRSRGRPNNKRLKTLVLNNDGKLEVKYYDKKLKVNYF